MDHPHPHGDRRERPRRRSAGRRRSGSAWLVDVGPSCSGRRRADPARGEQPLRHVTRLSARCDGSVLDGCSRVVHAPVCEPARGAHGPGRRGDLLRDLPATRDLPLPCPQPRPPCRGRRFPPAGPGACPPDLPRDVCRGRCRLAPHSTLQALRRRARRTRPRGRRDDRGGGPRGRSGAHSHGLARTDRRSGHPATSLRSPGHRADLEREIFLGRGASLADRETRGRAANHRL